MQELLKTGQVLVRSEMKKIIAGSGGGDCEDVCEDIARECINAPYFPGQIHVCTQQLHCCYGTCDGTGC